jgi:hypothetical protein
MDLGKFIRRGTYKREENLGLTVNNKMRTLKIHKTTKVQGHIKYGVRKSTVMSQKATKMRNLKVTYKLHEN